MPLPRWIPKALAVIAIACSASPARANIAAPLPNPSRVGGPRFATKTPLVVREERLSFQCDEADDGPFCAFEARYRIENPSTEPAGGRAAFYGVLADRIEIRVDGRRAEVPLSDADVKALDAEVAAAESPDNNSSKWQNTDMPIRQGFDITVPASGRSEIVVTGIMKPGRTSYSKGYVFSAAEGRHLLLYAGDTAARIFELDYLISPIKTWADVHRLIITIRHPKAWSLSPALYGSPNRSQTEWQEREDGDWIIKSVDTQGRIDPKDVGNTLHLFVSLPGFPVEHGGPFVGIGAVVGSNDASGFRMRFGYEMAAPSWLVQSVTADTDFTRRLVLSPNVEAALPHVAMLPILPSLGVGVGVPVQIMPKATVGARVFGTVQLWAVGFVTVVDIFPGLSSEEGRYQVSLMGRASL